jgi:hypothetical protein
MSPSIASPYLHCLWVKADADLSSRNELQRAISAEGVLWTVREAWPAAEGYWNLTVRFPQQLQSRRAPIRCDILQF